MSAERFHALEPRITVADVVPREIPGWAAVDRTASAIVGHDCLGVPSVRVGLGWTLEYLGMRRHRDHVLLPKFVGRCILNSLSRYALPVEHPTPETRAVVVVDQYGLRHDHDAMMAECRRNDWVCLEDSPYGLGHEEGVAPGSLARFIGLGKILPVAQGALVLSRDGAILDFIRRKRAEWSGWSWLVWGAIAALRMRRAVSSYSALADAAYEMYVPARGGNVALRANMLRGLARVSADTIVHETRLRRLASRLGSHVLMPDLRRLAYVVPFVPGPALDAARAAFRRTGFDPTVYHVDVHRNPFDPSYVRTLLIPVNVRVPDRDFDALTECLARLVEESPGPLLPSTATVNAIADRRP